VFQKLEVSDPLELVFYASERTWRQERVAMKICVLLVMPRERRPEGVEQFVSTPELHSDEAIESDPLPPGQVWAVGMGSPETGAGLYRLEVTSGPGAAASKS